MPQNRDDHQDPSAPQGAHPSDTEALAGDTVLSEPLTSAPRVQPSETSARDVSSGNAHRAAEPQVPTGERAEEETERGRS